MIQDLKCSISSLVMTTSSTTRSSASISSCTISIPSRVPSEECNYVDETELLNMEQLESIVNSHVKETMARIDKKKILVS